MVTGQLGITFLEDVWIDSVVMVEVRLASRDGNRFNLEAAVRTEDAGGKVLAKATSTFHELTQKWRL